MTNTPDPDDPPYQLANRSITTLGPNSREFYDGELTHGVKLVVGHEYWHQQAKYLLTVRDVVTRVRLDNNGEEMSAGPKYVSVKSDHPKHSEGTNDGTMLYSLEEFCMKVKSGTLVPHDANDYQPPQMRL